MKFLVWDPLNGSRETAQTFDCGIEEDAAREWAEQDEQSGEPFMSSYVDVFVLKDGDGEPSSLRIYVDYSRDYTIVEQTASKVKP